MSGSKMQVRFLDDDRSFLEGLRHTLHRMRDRWEMTFFQDADEALEAVHRRPVDVVLTDVKLPGRGGLEFLRALRESEATRDIPVLVVTGAGQRDLKRRALRLGAEDLMTKPVHREDLTARIESLLRMKSYRDQLKELNASLERQVAQRTRDLEHARLGVIWRLAKAGEFRDEETGKHVARVGCYCRILAETLGLSHEFVDRIFVASPLHDIGKIGVPGEILLKHDSLTAEEARVVRRHCEIGANILIEQPKGVAAYLEWKGLPPDAMDSSRHEGLRMAATIAYGHHEKWNGGGYPLGVEGEDIPLEARVAGLADVYDALTSQRPYKCAFPHDKAVGIIRGERGGHFDPAVVEAFCGALGRIYEVRKQFADEQKAPEAGASSLKP